MSAIAKFVMNVKDMIVLEVLTITERFNQDEELFFNPIHEKNFLYCEHEIKGDEEAIQLDQNAIRHCKARYH